MNFIFMAAIIVSRGYDGRGERWVEECLVFFFHTRSENKKKIERARKSDQLCASNQLSSRSIELFTKCSTRLVFVLTHTRLKVIF